MTMLSTLSGRLRRSGTLGLVVALLGAVAVAPAARAADDLNGSISDVRVDGRQMTASLIFRTGKVVKLDPDTVRAKVGGKPAGIDTLAGQKRSTMLVIDTSQSMEASGMATVREAVREFLDEVPKDVKVGVVSFASTAGIDVAPTTDHAKVSKAVGSLVAKGETALYQAVQIAAGGLGTEGERSIILLSDGGDTIAADLGPENADKEREAAVSALEKGKVRAEVISFNKGSSTNKAGKVLDEFAQAGGGSVAPAKDSEAVTRAFTGAARALGSQTALKIVLPNNVEQKTTLEITGIASGQEFTVTQDVDLGDTSPVVVPSGGPIVAAATPSEGLVPLDAVNPAFLIPAIGVLGIGLFLVMVAFLAPMFRSRRSERVSAIEAYGFGKSPQRQAPTPSVIGETLVSRADTFMEGR
jgi:tight adherence protein B